MLKYLSKDDIIRLETPMSKKARKMFFDMMTALNSIGKMKPKECAKILSESYSAVGFEDLVHKFEPSSILKLLPKRVKTLDEYRFYISLKFLSDSEWCEKNEVQFNRNKVGGLSGKAAELYKWMTESFLMTDFNEYDLNKIAHMGSGIYDLETVITEGNKIKDPDKRSVSYLYAIVRDDALKQHALKQRDQSRDDDNMSRLSALIKSTTTAGNTVAYEPAKPDEFDRIRIFAESARSAKD
jgi:hypothetical protein